MASQYDAIGSKYNIFKELPTSIVEIENVKEAVLTCLSKTDKPRVLDLACGTGYYSKLLLDWGADFVHGVDLSSGMIDAAKRHLSEDERYKDKYSFEVANVTHLGKVESGRPFDLVIGMWLLNYASSLDEMTKMFTAISSNLKEGGVFVGITPTVAEDVDGLAKTFMYPNTWPVAVDYYERLDSGEGWKTEVSSNVGPEEDRVKFRNYHLQKSVYEKGARQGGMEGKLEWRAVRVPERAAGTMPETFWKEFVESGTHMGLLVVEK